MEEMSKHGQVGRASMMANLDRKTGRKYVAACKLPSELKSPRTWRTRPDPFEADWAAIETQLKALPGLEAKTIFEHMMETSPGRYEEGQLRTLQRRVRLWRATAGPEKEVFFPQCHRPGEAAQTDFTSTGELGITIDGEPFAHLLCVFVLPYSNWQWVTVSLSESMTAMRRGVQAALFRLGRVPTFHQTDNSTAATHEVGDKSALEEGGSRRFNADYLALMRHYAMTPRTIAVRASEQNGDVESSNGAFKRALEQALLLRGSRDFDSRQGWEQFAQTLAEKKNRARARKLDEEIAAMRIVNVARLPDFVELDVRVSEWSTLRVKYCAYSVPSRLIGALVRVHLYEDRLEVLYGGKLQLQIERLRGDSRHRIDYRHIIWSLVQKPGAFARYRYRQELFPSTTFRRAYDAIDAHHRDDARGCKGDLEYLRILHLAASTTESDVESALELLLEGGARVTADAVKSLVKLDARIEVPFVSTPTVNLESYDALLPSKAVAS